MKRGIDFILAAICLVLFAPLMAFCALAIRREDGEPVIYSQERIGRHGKPFMIYKFRTMRKDAEDGGMPKLVETPDDPRLTRIGAKLRKHHLDELPQLWNVVKGDMAFIGPRPERKYYIDKIMQHDPRYEQLYALRPGVTSYATLYNGYADTMEKMLRRLDLDLYYLQHHSLWMDASILFKTFLSIVSGKVF
jgi:lipopolysaccharide/colanic/teichoic acid biosynthesis glycosyltransferase